MPVAHLSSGPLHYRIVGPDEPEAPVAVFVHGFLMDSTLWDGVADRLAATGVRCVLPDLPLGAHRHPCSPEADLSPVGQAGIVRSLLEAVDVHDVTLVGNDTGGAIVQLVLAGDRSRVGSVVLTNCDAFETFPPRLFAPIFAAARYPRVTRALLAPMRWRAVRHSPLAYGLLMRRPRPAALTAGWVEPARTIPAVRDDLARFARAMTGDELVEAASWLEHFTGPVRLVWGAGDRSFTIKLAERLAAAFTSSPDVRLVELAGVPTLVPIEDPDAVVTAINEVARTRSEQAGPN
jgi:pimeloyl-ACP methyl ester carboxylesterase